MRDAQLVSFVPTRDFVPAKAFYQEKLELKLVQEDAFALVFSTGGCVLRVVKVRELTPQPFTILGWQVEDIVATVRSLATRGVSFVRYGHFEQDELGIWTAPSGDRVAWFQDPDGNTLSISSNR